jgi:23S rRNA (uracil1939-C5)-methyltransferase
MLFVRVRMSAPARPSVTGGERVLCTHAARCGGCPLIDLPYGEQLEAKRARVAGALAAYPALQDVQTRPVEPANPIAHYRTRAKWIVGPQGELGLYARGSGHEVVDLPSCQVLAPVLATIAQELRTRIAAAAIEGGPLAPPTPEGPGALRAVDLREVRDGNGPSGALVTLVFDRQRAPDRRALEAAAADLVRALPQVVGVAANLQREGAAQILGSETLHLAGASAAPDRVGTSMHLATFGSFVQAHRGQAAKVHAAVADAVGRCGPRPRVLDLYGGSGAIALGLAARGAEVRLVESFAPAVAQAVAAARRQGLDLRTECADAARSVETLADAHERFDAVVLNPPRRGASAEVREGIARLAPKIVVYVSCDPQTLARDLDRFAHLGYRASVVQPLDMIPLTGEVEAVAVLERGALPPPRVLYEDEEIVAVDKGPHEVVHPEGRGLASLTDRVRSLAGAAQAVAVLSLEPEASGVVVFARSKDAMAAWASTLAAPSTRVEFVVGARGILRAKGWIERPLRRGRRLVRARIRYTRSAVFATHSLARATPDSPSTDALRHHLAAIGHPILGDDRSGDRATNRYFAEKAGLDRAFLHRARVEVDVPRTGGRLVIEAPLAPDLQAVVDRYPPAVKA